ncbi:hypothetical protein [Pontibacter sp. G13]|uniref:hypothetical protein n=1 Tax=Pontibacter sp. G13 TaxID=3074898 RepID=UPI00288ABDAA|nr:hypothetical protein [Pontibacter sp. G13]WNJ18663.1 hypothetical protein RJD25_27725 [Pontibacter sp. G13]
MYRYCLLLVIPGFLILSHVSAQNAMFVPFGQTHAELSSYLLAKDYFDLQTDSSTYTMENRISPTQFVRYEFQQDQLYAVADVREFPTRKQADKAVKSITTFFSKSGGKVRTLSSTFKLTHYAVVRDDRILEVKISKIEADRTLVELKAISRGHGPVVETESYANEIGF